MGFWSTLEDMLHGAKTDKLKSLDMSEYTKQKINKEKATKEMIEGLVKERTISEPVLSIIQTLKGGEWSFNTIGCLRDDAVYFTHEWFGHQLTVYNFSHCKTGPECQSEWMTQAEKEAVGSVCWQIYQGRVAWEKEQSLAKQRESFMILVKEK